MEANSSSLVSGVIADTNADNGVLECNKAVDALSINDKLNTLTTREIVNLNAPPRERWKHIVLKYKGHFKELVDYIYSSEREEFGQMFGNTIGATVAYIAGAFGHNITPTYIRDELAGIADITEEFGLNFGRLLQLNIGYDLIARCTSAVGTTSNGLPIILRNMDWDADIFRKLTIDVEFQRDGKTVYRGTTWVGFVGILTAAKMETSLGAGYAVTLNFRWVATSLIWNVIGSLNNYWPISFLIRDVLETKHSYETAVEALATSLLMAPTYFIVCGPKKGEGVVLSRNRTTEEKRYLLGNEQDAVIAQTNCDQWVDKIDPVWAEGDPLLIDSVERRNSFKENYKSITKEGHVDNYFIPLASTPVCNYQTLYSVIMSPGNSIYRSWTVGDTNTFLGDVKASTNSS